MKEKIIKLIELVTEKKILEENDTDKDKMMESNPYAFREGYETDNMIRINEIDKEIDKLELNK